MANASSASEGINWTMVLGILMILVVFATFALPTMLVLAVGMLPSGVAYIIDRNDQKFATFCVGGLNLCGVFPYVLKLMTHNHTMAAATETISDIFVLLVMYAAAGFGWMMFLAIPPVITSILSVMDQARVKSLRTMQREIMEEWGPEVTSAVDDEPIDAPPEAPSG